MRAGGNVAGSGLVTLAGTNFVFPDIIFVGGVTSGFAWIWTAADFIAECSAGLAVAAQLAPGDLAGIVFGSAAFLTTVAFDSLVVNTDYYYSIFIH